ncbi:MAG: ankyrin repeat domain-containing protein, partial [Candidatus Babeliales bacterium]
VEELLANGASVNAGNFLDFTPLHYAAAEGDIEMINILSKYKPNVNAQEANGQTPLHKAKDGKTVKCLLSLGAAIIKDNDLKTPLHRKILCKNMYNTFDAIEELIASGKENLDAISELDSPLGIAIGVNDLEVMKMLIKAGANVNKRGKDLTPLRKAVSLKRIAMVQYLLSNGANVNDGIVKGTTPLHLAVKSKNKELCQLLCNAGADTTIKDEESRTPFDLALEHWQ